MNGNEMVGKVRMECPLCGNTHEVEERSRTSKTVIKGENVEFEERYFFCEKSHEDEHEFVDGRTMDENLMRARNAYRVMHGLLTSEEIVAIRESYGLSQVDMAKLLGWGEATISRYESKAIQDEAYDIVLRQIRDNPQTVYEYLRRNGEKLTGSKVMQIREKVEKNMEIYGREYLNRRELLSQYAAYSKPCDANGYKTLDIDKIEAIVSFYAKKIEYLYKTKLMKMIWYADTLCFKKKKVSMTGLVYRCDKLGALPVGHYKIVGLENISVREEAGEDLENVRYRFLPNDEVDESCLTEEEREILTKVADKFKGYTATDIVNYMHDEEAYKQTEDGKVISYSLALENREF